VRALGTNCGARRYFPNQGSALPLLRCAAKFGGALALRATRCRSDAAVKFTPLAPAALPLEVAPGRQAREEELVAQEFCGRGAFRAEPVLSSARRVQTLEGSRSFGKPAAPSGACRLHRTWDCRGLTHPSSLVELKRLKMIQIRGFPRSAASSTSGGSRALELWRTGPKGVACTEIEAFSARQRQLWATRYVSQRRVEGSRSGLEGRKVSWAGHSGRGLRLGALARGASPRSASPAVHGTGFAALSVGKRPTTAQSR
jgi:hypothetical protein